MTLKRPSVNFFLLKKFDFQMYTMYILKRGEGKDLSSPPNQNNRITYSLLTDSTEGGDRSRRNNTQEPGNNHYLLNCSWDLQYTTESLPDWSIIRSIIQKMVEHHNNKNYLDSLHPNGFVLSYYA